MLSHKIRQLFFFLSLHFLYLYEVAALSSAAAAAASVVTLFLMQQSLKPERNSSAITTFSHCQFCQ